MEVDVTAEEVQIISALGVDITIGLLFRVRALYNEESGNVEQCIERLCNEMFNASSNCSSSQYVGNNGGNRGGEEGQIDGADVTPSSSSASSALDADLRDFLEMFDELLSRDDLDDIWFK